jgi:glyceraldehyde 3-phosphate dehydrogenase
MRIAINGFGRIGRSFLRMVLLDDRARKNIEVVAINVGPEDPEQSALVFQYDSIMGIYPHSVTYQEGFLKVQGLSIKILAEKDASLLPWKNLNIDWVVDCSGKYTHRKDAQLHQKAGAGAVLVSAPGREMDCTIVPGVNNERYVKGKDTIVSLASCTTNAFMPILKIISEIWGIEFAMMTTTHAYTASQSLVDSFSRKDIRRGRAAALNIVPTTTGADRMVAEVLPELKGRVMATALRVPVANVSFIDVTWVCDKKLTIEEINKAFVQSAQNSLRGILDVITIPLVSSDFAGNQHSVVIDTTQTLIVGSMGKICGWYDNEIGYSARLRDFLLHIA